MLQEPQMPSYLNTKSAPLCQRYLLLFIFWPPFIAVINNRTKYLQPFTCKKIIHNEGLQNLYLGKITSITK